MQAAGRTAATCKTLAKGPGHSGAQTIMGKEKRIIGVACWRVNYPCKVTVCKPQMPLTLCAGSTLLSTPKLAALPVVLCGLGVGLAFSVSMLHIC